MQQTHDGAEHHQKSHNHSSELPQGYQASSYATVSCCIYKHVFYVYVVQLQVNRFQLQKS